MLFYFFPISLLICVILIFFKMWAHLISSWTLGDYTDAGSDWYFGDRAVFGESLWPWMHSAVRRLLPFEGLDEPLFFLLLSYSDGIIDSWNWWGPQKSRSSRNQECFKYHTPEGKEEQLTLVDSRSVPWIFFYTYYLVVGTTSQAERWTLWDTVLLLCSG